MTDHDFHNSLTVSFEEPEDKRGYEPDTNSTPWFVGLMMLVGLVLVGIDMWPTDKATPVPNTSTQQSQFASADLVEQTNTPLSQSAYTSKAIEQIRLGDRVLGQNPQVSDEERELFSQIDPATWRHIRLRMTKPDGSLLHINYLRPLLWFEQIGAAVGQTIPLDLRELGVTGNALVLEINPCPPIKKGPGQVVTGTYVHQKADVIDLAITGQPDPIGTTANHPFWSEDRHAFVEAGKLYVGEQLRTMEEYAKVVSIIPRVGPQTVYNLEINGENVYHVGSAGALVHNYNFSTLLGNNLMDGAVAAANAMRKLGYEAHHIIAWNKRGFSKLRNLLDEVGIDYTTDAVNGVWLPGPTIKKFFSNDLYHRGKMLHGVIAIEKLEARLLGLKGNKQAIINELQKVANEMQNGIF